MTDGPDYNDARTKAVTLEVIKSKEVVEYLASAVAKVLEERAIDMLRRAKKCRCARCCPPPVSCRPPLSVMWMPIPILNPFWWAQACQPQCGPHHCEPHHCEPGIPESRHEDPQTPPRHPGGIG